VEEPQRHGETDLLGVKAIPAELTTLTGVIVDAAFKVHKTLGPGLLESVYERCLRHEFRRRGIPFQAQVSFPVHYDGIKIDAGLRLNLIVAGSVVVELKAVDAMHPLYTAQLLTYLKLTGLRLGLLINFNVPLIRDGIKRIAL
jgi:GxxExxY protein